MFSLCLASAADGCRSDVHDSVLVVVGWYGVVREGAVTGGAGRDLRHVGVRGGDRRGPRRGRGLMLRAARSKVANWRGGITRPVTHRGGGMPTRAVVMGRSEPLAGVVGRCTRWHCQVGWWAYRPRVVLCVGSGGKPCPSSRSGGGRGHPGDLVPDGEAVGHLVPPSGGRQQMPTRTEMWRDAAER